MTVPVIALPGGVMPAAMRYAPLASALGDEAQFHIKDLEVYAEQEPPAGYSIDLEIEGLARFANSLRLDRFHLLGYSGGGFVSLAFAGAHPDRLLSLALFEPASVPGDLCAEEARHNAQLRTALAGLDGPEFMRAFMSVQVRPGVEIPPPSGPPPPWMRNRPAGIAAMMAALGEHRFDRARFRECRFPVFLGYGDLTGAQEEVMAAILGRLLPDVHIRRFSGIHHFVPPEQIYTTDHVHALRNLWARAAVPVTA
ncbi:MAG: alpha/beta hydrolase [Candidatus Nephthysia bennettiae]|uniref:Alpha/beta hydrolase n=1 Tax=Candidatus Nephthysia bennettiae TaxID=3127016 RepID=A0A934K4U9_9BACT|nr:alpha/beta hydrolase [Candidatus Dormibacteraeota bacterium]PZR90536.1 MAG: alpha/beta hydrolase [Candidatus Dormibacteraeota bacterium]